MSGDFSRLTFDPTRHYDSVLLQQGRPQLDADWNEQRAIDAHRRELEGRDVIGQHGAPRVHAGFAVQLRAALDFDGRDDVVRVAPDGSLHGLEFERFTLELHVCLPADHTAAGVLVSSDGGHWRLRAEPDGRVAYYNGSGPAALTSGRPLPFGETCRITLTCDAHHMRLLFEEQVVAEAECPLEHRAHRAPTMFGAIERRRSSSEHFYGQLENMRLTGTSDLIAAWPMRGRDADQLARDTSGHRNDLVGGPGTPNWLVRELLIGTGRMYVDGLLCENEHSVLMGAPDATQCVVYLDVWKQDTDAIDDPSLREVALGGADTSIRSRITWQVRSLPVADEDHDWRLDWQTHVDRSTSTGCLRARRQAATGVEVGNQLYRVQIHRPGERGQATFKWSRDNASQSFSVLSLDAHRGVIALMDLGRDSYALQSGDWVEFLDDHLTRRLLPGPLLQVGSIDRARNTTVVSGDLQDISLDISAHPRLLRWDHSTATIPVPETTETWVTLERGVQVAFADAAYHAGDYWLVPTRTALADVVWSVDPVSGAQWRRPDGVLHHYCPVALVHLHPEHPRVQDERRLFDPLTSRVDVHEPTPPGTWSRDLHLEGDLSVRGDTHLHGRVQVGRLGGQLDPALVDTDNLVDGAVTRAKLAPDVGFVPPGYSVLGDTREPPPGYIHNGGVILVDQPARHWSLEVDEPGTISTACVGDTLYLVSELGSVWAFDLDDQSLRTVARLAASRLEVRALGVSGRLLLIGGLAPSGQPSGAVTELDLETLQWRERAPIPVPRSQAAVAGLDSRVHVIGGRRRGMEPVAQHDVYDAERDEWSRRADLRAARYGLAAAAVDEFVFVLGGEARSRQWRGAGVVRLEVFDTRQDRWFERSPLPAEWQSVAVIGAGHRVVTLGSAPPRQSGGSAVSVSQRMAYQPRTDWWSPQAPLPRSGSGLSLARVGSTIFAITTTPSAIHIDAVEQELFVHRCITPSPMAD
jgi:uncharacterized protein DUF6519